MRRAVAVKLRSKVGMRVVAAEAADKDDAPTGRGQGPSSFRQECWLTRSSEVATAPLAPERQRHFADNLLRREARRVAFTCTAASWPYRPASWDATACAQSDASAGRREGMRDFAFRDQAGRSRRQHLPPLLPVRRRHIRAPVNPTVSCRRAHRQRKARDLCGIALLRSGGPGIAEVGAWSGSISSGYRLTRRSDMLGGSRLFPPESARPAESHFVAMHGGL
jgi:hypothetical protein